MSDEHDPKTYVVLDDVTPARGTIVRVGQRCATHPETGLSYGGGICADRGQLLCRWVGVEPPVKGSRAWHRRSDDGFIASV